MIFLHQLLADTFFAYNAFLYRLGRPAIPKSAEKQAKWVKSGSSMMTASCRPGTWPLASRSMRPTLWMSWGLFWRSWGTKGLTWRALATDQGRRSCIGAGEHGHDHDRVYCPKGIKLVLHAPYSPDLAPPDFWLFPKIKANLALEGLITKDSIRNMWQWLAYTIPQTSSGQCWTSEKLKIKKG